jgi:hypothetical protein
LRRAKKSWEKLIREELRRGEKSCDERCGKKI